MKTQPTAAQIKQLERTINHAAADLEYVTEFLVAQLKGAVGVEESVIRQAVQTAAGCLIEGLHRTCTWCGVSLGAVLSSKLTFHLKAICGMCLGSTPVNRVVIGDRAGKAGICLILRGSGA